MKKIRATINWTDHHYTTKDFAILDELPREGDVKDLPEEGYRRTCAAVHELTEKIARSDFGDYGRYRFFIAYYDDELYLEDEDEDGNPFKYLEPDGESFAYIAIWEPSEEEEEEV